MLDESYEHTHHDRYTYLHATAVVGVVALIVAAFNIRKRFQQQQYDAIL